MARDHAQIRLDMWGDDDWRRLSVRAQHLYMLLLTSPSLSLCGVADWRPARIARLAHGWTTTDVLKAADELTGRLFLVIDDETEEVLIRSFVRHDGLMKMPNMATAMATAHAAIASEGLRGVVVHELRRLHEKQPSLPGWRSPKARAVLERTAIDPSANPSRNPSVKGSPNPSVNPSVNPSPSPTPTPAPTPSTSKEVEELPSSPADAVEAGDPFDEFWNHYPRKVAKIAARKAFAKAIKTVAADVIVAAAARYAADPNLPTKDEEAATPHPATWLNEGRWDDPPLPARLNRRRTPPAQASRVEIDGTPQTLWPANFTAGKTYGELKAAGYPMDDF